MEKTQNLFGSNPFYTSDDVLPIIPTRSSQKVKVDLQAYNKLKDTGRLIATYVIKNLDHKDGSCILVVEKLAVLEFGTYEDASATRIRRGIRDLVKNNFLAKSTIKNLYWVNPYLLWDKI